VTSVRFFGGNPRVIDNFEEIIVLQYSKCTYKAKLRRFSATIVAVENQ